MLGVVWGLWKKRSHTVTALELLNRLSFPQHQNERRQPPPGCISRYRLRLCCFGFLYLTVMLATVHELARSAVSPVPDLLPAHQPQHTVYKLVVVTLVQNEARWLPEWLEFHLLPAIGVEQFYLYDDDSSGVGSTDGLTSILAPYRGLVTLHRVSELDVPFPDPAEETVSDMTMCSHSPPWPEYHRVGGHKCVRNRFQFPQQAVVIRHAAATYGHQSRAMLLIDVDEFLMHTPVLGASSLIRHARVPARLWNKSVASVLVTALHGRVGAVHLHTAVMLPDETFFTHSSDDGLFLTRNCTRQLVDATTHKNTHVSMSKNAVLPHALALLDGYHYYGTIHQPALRGRATKTVSGASLGLQLMHFRYRSASAWAARRNKTYLRPANPHDRRAATKLYTVRLWHGGRGAPRLVSFTTAEEGAVAQKDAQMVDWEELLHEALRTPQTHSAPQLGLLQHWAALATALTKRWQKHSASHASTPLPPAIRGLIDASAVVVSRLSVLLVAEPRSGSTLIGKLSFDARKDFLYVYEPCRMAPKGKGFRRLWGGTFFDAECTSWVAKVLQCGLSLSGFGMLRRDAGGFKQSSALAAIAEAQLLTKRPRSLDDGDAYVDWLHCCWSSHRAAKVVRIRDPAALSTAPQVDDAQFKIVHLVRDPTKVIASRLSLETFTRRGFFNPEGGAEGVVRATCRAMNAMVRAPLLPSALRRYEYEEVLRSPTAFLSDLYAWLGLEGGLPPSVLRMVTQCRLGNHMDPSLGSGKRFRVCEFEDKLGHQNRALPPPVQLTQQQRELVASHCSPLPQRSTARWVQSVKGS